jgi:hypothetical protein
MEDFSWICSELLTKFFIHQWNVLLAKFEDLVGATGIWANIFKSLKLKIFLKLFRYIQKCNSLIFCVLKGASTYIKNHNAITKERSPPPLILSKAHCLPLSLSSLSSSSHRSRCSHNNRMLSPPLHRLLNTTCKLIIQF